MGETWLPVVGYEGSYEVSSLGAVRSIDRIDNRGSRALGRRLRPDATASGHLRVTLSRDGKTRRFFVHRLVLWAFVGCTPPGMEACHNDGDPTNNAVSNLRWDTKSANAQDRRRHGRDHHARQTHCPQGHEYSPSNVYLNARGWRHCRTCSLACNKVTRSKTTQDKGGMRWTSPQQPHLGQISRIMMTTLLALGWSRSLK